MLIATDPKASKLVNLRILQDYNNLQEHLGCFIFDDISYDMGYKAINFESQISIELKKSGDFLELMFAKFYLRSF